MPRPFSFIDQKLQKQAIGVNILKFGLERALDIASADNEEGNKIVIPQEIIVGKNLTVPSNVYLHFTNVGSIQVRSGYTLTVNGTVFSEGGDDFTGEGTVDLSEATLFSSKNETVSQFGAVGDGITDDTVSINKAIEAMSATGGDVIFESGNTYMVDAETSIKLKSDVSLLIPKTTTIKAIANNVESYQILKAENISNFKIYGGGTIEGERDDHVGTTGEWGMGISILGCNGYEISDLTIIDCWGDGIYIGTGTAAFSANGYISNVTCDNNRRQGMSIISVKKLTVENSSFINTNGTLPTAGIDLEPNDGTNFLENVYFSNIYTENNGGSGFIISTRNLTNDISITVDGLKDVGSNQGIYIEGSADVPHGGIVDIYKFVSEDANEAGILSRNKASSYMVNVHNPTIVNANTSEGGSTSYSSAISIMREAGDTSTGDIGGFRIVEPDIFGDKQVRSICVNDEKGLGVANISIENPINLGTPTTSKVFMAAESLSAMSDRHKTNSFSAAGNVTFYGADAKNYFDNTGSAGLTTVTLSDSVPLNFPVKLTNLEGNAYRVLATAGTILPDQAVAGNYISSSTKGDSITIERIDTGEFIITNKIGTWTAEV